jgi:predicted Zn-dependent protease
MQQRQWLQFIGTVLLGSVLGLSCSTSPLGRKQFIIIPEAQVNQMGTQAFQELKSTEPVSNQSDLIQYVLCVARPITNAAAPQTGIQNWDVTVFENTAANAFALPGGKIGVYTGLLKVAKTQDQLAAVLGHEVGHVIAHHGAERMSQQAGTQLGLTALGELTRTNPNNRLLMGLLGVGTQVGILLPFSRIQESEADLIGLDLMAKAGFNPQHSVDLWKNMIQAAGGKAPPQWLSTHPASEKRIENLQAHMANALTEYTRAQQHGRAPKCTP